MSATAPPAEGANNAKEVDDEEMPDQNASQQQQQTSAASHGAATPSLLAAEEEFSDEEEGDDDDGDDLEGPEKKKGKAGGGKGRRIVSPRVNALQIWSFKQKKYIYEKWQHRTSSGVQFVKEVRELGIRDGLWDDQRILSRNIIAGIVGRMREREDGNRKKNSDDRPHHQTHHNFTAPRPKARISQKSIPAALTSEEIEDDIAVISGVKKLRDPNGMALRRVASSSALYRGGTGASHIAAAAAASGISPAVLSKLETDVRRLQSGLQTCRTEIFSVNSKIDTIFDQLKEIAQRVGLEIPPEMLPPPIVLLSNTPLPPPPPPAAASSGQQPPSSASSLPNGEKIAPSGSQSALNSASASASDLNSPAALAGPSSSSLPALQQENHSSSSLERDERMIEPAAVVVSATSSSVPPQASPTIVSMNGEGDGNHTAASVTEPQNGNVNGVGVVEDAPLSLPENMFVTTADGTILTTEMPSTFPYE